MQRGARRDRERPLPSLSFANGAKLAGVASDYEQAVSTLYQAAHESFVSERTRLAAELKASGDKASAAKLAKLGRPTISAWAVNQLWWHSRAAFDELFASAKQLRAGKHSASAAHRQTLQKLTTAAHKVLSAAGHSAGDATLRRVTMTLSGLAATGSFEPDPDGALTKDRDPPGFEAFGMAGASDSDDDDDDAEPDAEPAPKSERVAKPSAADKKREAAERAAEKAAEKQREAEQRAQRQAEKREAEAEQRAAKHALGAAEHERDQAAKALQAAERAVEKAREQLERAEQRVREASED